MTEEEYSEQLQEATNGRRDVDVDIADANLDYEVNLIAKNDKGEEISWDESKTPNTLLEEIDSGQEMHAATAFRYIRGGNFDDWNRKFRGHDGRTTEVSDTVYLDRPVSSLLRSKHRDELQELKEGYNPGGVRGKYILRFDNVAVN